MSSASSLPRLSAACQTNSQRNSISPPPRDLAGVRGGAGGATEQKPVAEAQPGDWVTLEGKVVSLAAPASPAIAQSGIIADEWAGISFVVWAKSNAPKMEEGKWSARIRGR